MSEDWQRIHALRKELASLQIPKLIFDGKNDAHVEDGLDGSTRIEHYNKKSQFQSNNGSSNNQSKNMLTEDHCIEILHQIIKLKLVSNELLFTSDGKGFVFPQRLDVEVMEYTELNGGD